MRYSSNIIPGVRVDIPNYKDNVGEFIFPFIETILGRQEYHYAPKIAGMMIDLPCYEIVEYLSNFNSFISRFDEAKEMIRENKVCLS